MSFVDLKKGLQNNFEKMMNETDYLFEVELDKDILWNLYLDSFPEGTNELFRERREFDCSCCRQFIKKIGNVVSIKNNEIKSIWDFEIDNPKYKPVIKELSHFVKSHPVTNVYLSKEAKIGTNKNLEDIDGNVIEWEHFYLELPNKLVKDNNSISIAERKSTYKSTYDVFKRSLDTLTEESVLTVLELISQNSLYKGEEWKSVLQEFLKHKKSYDKLSNNKEKTRYAWEHSVKVSETVGRIRNLSIGTLLIDISNGVELDRAVSSYETIVAPENYRRSKPIFTKKMLEDAQKKVVELGYKDSLKRRFATIEDISINDILFSNKDSIAKMEDFDVFDELAKEVSVNPKKFSKVEEVGIEKFVNDILPSAQELEVLLENKHSNNMTSLIAPQDKDSKSMFKWGNNFSWAYTGNITDSSMKENVKMAGGNIEGVLRFSIQWSDDEYNPDDFDAHCIEPCGNEIYYGSKYNGRTSGNLDVDIINPEANKAAVENITWSNKSRMGVGVYKLFVHNYSDNGGKDGFKAEVEFDGQIYSFEYSKELRHKESVQVAEVTLHEDGSFTVKEKLPSNVSSKELWGLQTNQFVPVSIVTLSPNHWGEEVGTGNKHYMFMLKDAINPESPSGFFNEFLSNGLRPHRKVFEALASKMRVTDDKNQLSGLGFSSTQRNSVIVKVKGQTERVLKVII